RKADNEIAGKGELWLSRAQLLDDPQIESAVMLAVHRRQNAVGTGLHREVQVGHQLVEVTVGGNQLLVHVPGVGGGVAQALQPIDFCEPPQEASQSPLAAVGSLSVVGIDVLAQQRDFQ